jgi:predicted small secreted protein
MKRLTASLLIAATALAACASTSPKDVSQAATTPLSDLNLVRADIPPVLAAAQKAPYAAPADKSCAALASEVQALDAALGADLDTPATPSNPSLVERGTGAAGDAAVGAVRGAAEGVIPFRGWVRKLTGAERYSREVAAAIAAGTIRRAYLKGLGQAVACAAPAAPRG